ncbi:protein phosphatase regulator [Ephemerocybe angulata]|uniref:Protein phosphatase regulator n=1 Tax=Ephemerocybe angulata TaxID=980116 RepID=A0A8H6I3I6_9AGAR|nr:protein phosphatase regulator [Tulosesus angulatus]
MIATISATPIRMSHQHVYTNTSAGPLPILPRRASSTRQIAAPLAPMAYTTKRTPVTAVPTKKGRSSSSSSSSSSESESGPSNSGSAPQAPLSIRARRARSAQAQGQFPAALANPIPPLSRPHVEEVTPKPGALRASKTEDNITTLSSQKSVSHFVYSPGTLRFGEARTPSTIAFPSGPGSAVDGTQLIRKKSGQLVKPSLKTSRSATGGLSMFSSKSEPATPVCKAVHFDSQLEHVKLFLAEQKPLAVSRDGSPTDDTSGTDSDFPSFIFGNDHNKLHRMKLNVRIVNMPARQNMRAEVCLEEVSVSTLNNAILGRVRVRNIAFVKTVAVRFTFDSWQTTSEVLAHYHDSPCSRFDRFSFTIKLDDLLARIEEKTLVLAIRYGVAGEEFWDNNAGQDYIAKFNRSAPRDRSLSDDESSENLVSLQTKLEKVVEDKDRTGPAFSASTSSSSPRSSPEPEEPSFKSTSSLASRYDFNASFKSPWKYHESPPTSHQRNNSYPQFTKPSKPAPLKTLPALGSPRDLADGVISDTPTTAVSTDDAPIEVPSREQSGRNHHRGYFDLSTFGSANVRRTPPTSPPPRSPEVLSPMESRASPFGPLYSFPSMVVEAKRSSPDLPPHRPLPLISGLFTDMMSFDSELSTPSLTTPNSSRSTTPSPTEQFLNLPPMDEESTTRGPATHYRELIDQYCFFTGGAQAAQDFNFGFAKAVLDNAFVDSPVDSTPKAFPEPRMRSISPLSSPSSSTDDLVSPTGSVTPSASRLNLHINSRSPTPTPCIA